MAASRPSGRPRPACTPSTAAGSPAGRVVRRRARRAARRSAGKPLRVPARTSSRRRLRRTPVLGQVARAVRRDPGPAHLGGLELDQPRQHRRSRLAVLGRVHIVDGQPVLQGDTGRRRAPAVDRPEPVAAAPDHEPVACRNDQHQGRVAALGPVVAAQVGELAEVTRQVLVQAGLDRRGPLALEQAVHGEVGRRGDRDARPDLAVAVRADAVADRGDQRPALSDGRARPQVVALAQLHRVLAVAEVGEMRGADDVAVPGLEGQVAVVGLDSGHAAKLRPFARLSRPRNA